jgi:hypothetical protein
MPPASDWRSSSNYAYILDLDPAELAWEFLRRNPEYQREHRVNIPEPSDDDAGVEAFAQHWGLQFPGRSESPCR